jgi:dTDP-4-amino-4,6-dideoxygalactose transaminase
VENITYGRHDVNNTDIESVNQVLRSNNLTMGDYLNQFENELAVYTQTKGAIGVSSGTAALHCAYSTLDLKGREVIISPMTFVATASTAAMQGARIVFSDIDANTGNLDATEIGSKLNSKTAVITCVDYAVKPVYIPEIRKVKGGKEILLFDDASHALGSKYKNKIIGGEADLTIFSFFPTKNITSGEGGAIVSNNLELLNKARSFKMHGLVRNKIDQRHPNEGDWHQEVHQF